MRSKIVPTVQSAILSALAAAMLTVGSGVALADGAIGMTKANGVLAGQSGITLSGRVALVRVGPHGQTAIPQEDLAAWRGFATAIGSPDTEIIPAEPSRTGQQVRVWVPAASTGAERIVVTVPPEALDSVLIYEVIELGGEETIRAAYLLPTPTTEVRNGASGIVFDPGQMVAVAHAR